MSTGLTLLAPRQDASAESADTLAVLGQSAELKEALETARRVALTDAAVFISGESGTGKELIAQFIHRHSPRRRGRFVPVNCAALPEGLFESELFGHRRGAVTGAVRDRPGILEVAHNGTLFLDELLEMPKAIQAKLLRVLVGSELPDTDVDVRVIAATNRDPAEALRTGELREDLFYRLHVVPIHLPPLRERPEDIPLLAAHFLTLYWPRHRGSTVPLPVLTPEALWAMSAHPWHGNLREMQNTVEHLVVLAEPGAPITPGQIPFRRDPGPERSPDHGVERQDRFVGGYREARERAIAAFEAGYVEWFVRRAGRNFSKAARSAGIDRTTLYRLMERHGLRRPRQSAE